MPVDEPWTLDVAMLRAIVHETLFTFGGSEGLLMKEISKLLPPDFERKEVEVIGMALMVGATNSLYRDINKHYEVPEPAVQANNLLMVSVIAEMSQMLDAERATFASQEVVDKIFKSDQPPEEKVD